MEAAITRDPLFRHALVLGEGQARLSVSAVVDPPGRPRVCAANRNRHPPEAGPAATAQYLSARTASIP